jgi:hypothetical protein
LMNLAQRGARMRRANSVPIYTEVEARVLANHGHQKVRAI